MYKYILQSLDNIQWMGITPLVLFFVLFVVIILNTWHKKNREIMNHMSALPLEEDQPTLNGLME